MPLYHKRWNDPAEPTDGWRLLITRYRPRHVKKEEETWDDWYPHLGPSPELFAAVYGKNGPPISFEEYARRYVEEMRKQTQAIDELAARVRFGESITLLCSSACWDADRCHRTLLCQLIADRLAAWEQRDRD